MKLMKQPNSWSCLPTAFEMVGDFAQGEIEEYLGKDGSEIIFPDIPTPYSRRTIHISECIEFMLANDYAVTPIIPQCYSGPPQYPGQIHKYSLGNYTLGNYMFSFPGIITGFRNQDGGGHAVAWCNKEKLIYDPNGTTYRFSELTLKLETFWLCSLLTTHPNYLNP